MSSFRLNLRSKLIKQLKTVLSSDHYLFLGNVIRWDNGGTDTALPTTDAINDDFKVYNEMISVHKLLSSDIYYALKKAPFVSGTIYDTYSSSRTNEFSKYYITRESGDIIYVYVCVGNNNGNAATTEPSLFSTGQFTNVTDGYIWKLVLEFSKPFGVETVDYYGFNSNSVSYSLRSGYIEKIDITKRGKSFPYVINADLSSTGPKIIQELDTNNDLVLKIDTSTINIPTNPNTAYQEYALYILNGSTIEKVYEIDGAQISGSNLTLSICNSTTQSGDVGKTYALLPNVKQIGNGTGLIYYPILNADKTINSLKIYAVGIGYGELQLKLDTYEFNPVFNYGELGYNFIKDLNITSLFIYKSLTASANPYTKTITSPTDLTIGSPSVTVGAFTANTYATNEIRQFGIICKNGDGSSDSEANPFTTNLGNNLSACDILTCKKLSESTEINFNINIIEFTNDDYICQLDVNGNVSSYGKVISITYDVNPPQTDIKNPKITVKRLFGTAFNTTSTLRKYTVNSNGSVTTTDTSILVKTADTSPISLYKGKIIYIDNIDPLKLVANQQAEFKIIFSI